MLQHHHEKNSDQNVCDERNAKPDRPLIFRVLESYFIIKQLIDLNVIPDILMSLNAIIFYDFSNCVPNLKFIHSAVTSNFELCN